MKLARIIFPIAALLGGGMGAGVALAGTVPAGTASGSTGVGSLVTPGSAELQGTPSEDEGTGENLPPGTAGSVFLDIETTVSAAEQMRAAGGVVDGAWIRVPTTLADGDAATIALNTQTGELLVRRNE